MNCKICSNSLDDSYAVVYQDGDAKKRLAYGAGHYCYRCKVFYLMDDLEDSRLSRSYGTDSD